MLKLLTIDKTKTNLLQETSFGGFPVKGTDNSIEWPRCENCDAELQYQGKIKTDIGIELIFMCSSNPGMCDDWDAESGGNKIIVVDAKKLEFFKPKDSDSIRELEYGVTVVETDDTDYYEAIENWEGDTNEIVGQLYGEPGWIQADETPDCNCCNKPMRFVAQLGESSDQKISMNFGGGMAYLFDCKEGKTAKFLWQC